MESVSRATSQGLKRTKGQVLGDELQHLNEGISKCQKVVAQLADTRKLFKDQREKAAVLRDGLFSASAVIESQASKRLGENVKLLTYVSIIYLPLAFCNISHLNFLNQF